MARYPRPVAGIIAVGVLAVFSTMHAAAPVRAVPVCDGPCTDLSIAVSGPDSGHVGEALEYDILVENEGPANTPDAVVTDTLPGGAMLVSAASTQGSCDDAPGGVLTCDLGELDYPGDATIALTVVPGTPGSNLNSASVQSALADPIAENNQDATDGSMSITMLGATLTKSGPATATNNSQLTYTLTANVPSCFAVGGECASTTFRITDALPAGETFVSVSTNPSASNCNPMLQVGTNGTVTCTWNNLNVGNAQTLTETIVVQLSTTAPFVTNQAILNDDFATGETVPSNPVTTTIATPTPGVIVVQAYVGLTIVTTGCGTTSPAGTIYRQVLGLIQNVVVTAQPCVGSRFLGWTGGPCNGTTINPCDIPVATSGTITANFSP